MSVAGYCPECGTMVEARYGEDGETLCSKCGRPLPKCIDCGNFIPLDLEAPHHEMIGTCPLGRVYALNRACPLYTEWFEIIIGGGER
jgi:hypothetical protein